MSKLTDLKAFLQPRKFSVGPKVPELVAAEWGQDPGLFTLRFPASMLPGPFLSPSPGAAEQMTGSLEGGTDVVGFHFMMGPLEVFLSANDHSRKTLCILH